MKNEFKIKARESLLSSAKDYFLLISKLIVLESEDFGFQKRYVLKFNKTNFLHLTGLKTNLSASDFFDRCFNASITVDDFCFDPTRKNTVKTN